MSENKVFHRPIETALLAALHRDPPLVQVLTGPRQVGKTTAALAVLRQWDGPTRYAAADAFLPPTAEWIRMQWALARRDAAAGPALLILDEVQKIAGWSETVKGEWDADRRAGADVRVVLLGSSALWLAKGVSESLAGRFLLHRATHWSFGECRAAFGFALDQFVFYGGYPGAAPFVGDEALWRGYVRDALIETVLARDVLALQTVGKPALLRQLFGLATRFPAQELSYNKMLGQLHEAGNTTTLAQYIRLLETAFLLTGLERFSAGQARSRGTSPKLVLWNNALVNALDTRSADDARQDPAWWGRLVENAVGAHLLNGLQGLAYEVTFWRERTAEVDFVVRGGHRLWAIEVKSGGKGATGPRTGGLAAFCAAHREAEPLIVGPGGIELGEFLAADAAEWLR